MICVPIVIIIRPFRSGCSEQDLIPRDVLRSDIVFAISPLSIPESLVEIRIIWDSVNVICPCMYTATWFPQKNGLNDITICSFILAMTCKLETAFYQVEVFRKSAHVWRAQTSSYFGHIRVIEFDLFRLSATVART